MALSSEELKLFEFAKSSLPTWVSEVDEFLLGTAKMFGSVRAIHDYFFGQTLISTAVGATSTTPDWLAQHARDRGTGRQLDEDDPTLRQRIRNVPDALTRSSILAAANAILAAAGIAGSVVMVELPRDGAHSGTYASMTGTGGTFSDPDANGVQSFEPTDGWATPPVDSTHTGYPWDSWHLTTTGAADAANDVDVDIDGSGGVVALDIVENAVQYSNPGGSADVDAGVSWVAAKMINPPYIADGFARSYSQRGYRSARVRPLLVILIVPYPAPESVALAIAEMLRQKKAAGYLGRVERRLNP